MKFEIGNLKSVRQAFSLVELMIVVSILGILAAIVLPEFQNHAKQAKEAAAKDNLRILRETIERYAAEHNGVPPGYPNNNTTATPDKDVFVAQLTTYSSFDGLTSATKTGIYRYGPYLNGIPINPFTSSNFMVMIPNAGILPASAWNQFGWIYKPALTQVPQLGG